MVPPVHQPDDDSCGLATTKWVLQFFGALDVSGKKLREELNTDAKRGVRALLRKMGLGDTLLAQKGTLPKPIFDALSRRGIRMKNPVRLESPLEYINYLNETFDEGGCAVMLLANTSILHWMGTVRVPAPSVFFALNAAGHQPTNAPAATDYGDKGRNRFWSDPKGIRWRYQFMPTSTLRRFEMQSVLSRLDFCARIKYISFHCF